MNKYSRLFHLDMTYEEIQTKYYSTLMEVGKGEARELFEAYNEVTKDIYERELREAGEYDRLD